MKKIALLSSISLLLLAVAGPAMACHFDTFYPAADCDGWNVNGNLSITVDDYADVSWVVTLSNGDGTVAEFNGSIRVYETDTTFSVGDPWGMELCGDYEATGQFHLESASSTDDESFWIAFTCMCDEPGGCTGTPGYWKNHPDAWPVNGLTVGCVDYTKEELLDIFDAPTRGDGTIKLFHHTVAAKLNVLTGAGDGIMGSIDDADAFLCDHPLFSHPGQPYKNEANGIKDELVAYNQSNPCGESICDTQVLPQMGMQASQSNDSSWGAMKASFK